MRNFKNIFNFVVLIFLTSNCSSQNLKQLRGPNAENSYQLSHLSFEGITSVPTKKVFFSKAKNDQKWLINIQNEFKEIMSYDFQIKIEEVNCLGFPFVQDLFITNSQNNIFLQFPKIEEKALYKFYVEFEKTFQHFPMGGETFNKDKFLGCLKNLNADKKVIHSFLEGGNVIIAKNKKSHIKVIVGREAIQYATVYFKISENRAKQLIAEDLSIKLDDLIIIPQVDYHIDLHLRAGQPGTVFLASFESGYMMLNSLGTKPFDDNNDYSEHGKIDELKERFQSSRWSENGKKQSEDLNQISKILKENDFTVKSYPYIYFSKKIFPKSYIAINSLNNRYITDSKGKVINFMLGSGYRLIDKYISSYERDNGSDQTFFLGRLSAEWSNFGNKVIEKLHGGMGCLTNIQ